MEIYEKNFLYKKKAFFSKKKKLFNQKGMRTMEDVLPTTMYRRIQLINLLRLTSRWLYLDEIAEKIGCSKKTVVSDCQYIEDRWSDIVTIETSQKNGIHLTETPNRSIRDIYIEIAKESSAFSLLEAVFFEPGKSGDYWAKKFFLSSSTLYRIAQNIDKALKQRNIHMNRTPYEIEGEDENKIRYFFSSYFCEVYGVHDWPFLLEREKVFGFVREIIRDLDLDFNDTQFMGLAYTIAVTIIRERQGHLINNADKEDEYYLENLNKFRKYTGTITEVIKPLNVKLPENWYEDFSYSIFWWEFGWNNPQEKVRIQEVGNDIVDLILEVLPLPITEKSRERISQLIEEIYAKHKMYPFKKYVIFNREQFASLTIRQSYAIFTKVLRKILIAKEKKTKFPWHSTYFDSILYEMMIRWENLPELLEEMRHQVKIGVYSDLGSDHAELLASFLRKNFKGKISLTVQDQPFYEMERKHFANCELNVSNFELKNVEEDQLFIVEDVPTFKNLVDLRKIIDDQRIVRALDIPFLNE